MFVCMNEYEWVWIYVLFFCIVCFLYVAFALFVSVAVTFTALQEDPLENEMTHLKGLLLFK